MDIPRFKYAAKKNWLLSKWEGVRRRRFLNHLHQYFRLNPITPDLSRIHRDSFVIIINNFNRFSSLKKMIDWIHSLDGAKSIIVVDNQSTFPPLLEYYKQLDIPNTQIIQLGINSGTEGAFLLADMIAEHTDYYVITDSDLVPYENTPKTILLHLKKILNAFPELNHVGTSLEINDLSENYPLYQKVFNWESKFWNADIVFEDLGYLAPIDTTFAMYRNSSDCREIFGALRAFRPYTLKHLDWYVNPNEMSMEYQYYIETSKNIATWAKEFLETQ